MIAHILAVALLSPEVGSFPTWLGDETYQPVTWKRAPDGDLPTRLYPGFAATLRVSGWAIVQCEIERDGHPFNCRATDERPYGLGFGAAARLVVASGELTAARRGGVPVSGSMRTVVRFNAPDPDTLETRPEPSGTRMRLARELLESHDDFPKDPEGDALDGLDHDRRGIVQPWVDELMPVTPEGRLQATIVQFARLFTEDELRALLAGEWVEPPTPEEFDAACPDLTPEEEAGRQELRRRYCERFGCGAEGSPPPSA